MKISSAASRHGPTLWRCGGRCPTHDSDQDKQLWRSALGRGPDLAPPIVDKVLASPGQPLDTKVRNRMETRLGHDFGSVRVHTGATAARSARSVDAAAYTVGHHVVLGPQATGPTHEAVLTHELVHVAQQRHTPPLPGGAIQIARRDHPLELDAARASATGSMTSPSSTETGNPSMLCRADPAAVARVMGRGTLVGSGIQFWPTNVVDTVVGPVSGRDRLGSSPRLAVIIGEALTVRGLARQLLPLWTTATPFTDPATGTVVPLTMINELELAQALLAFNQHYLPLPAMTQWRAGLRLPLPVDIDEATGVATLNPQRIKDLAGAFQAAWTPLLDQAAAATGVPGPADLTQQARDFLNARRDTASRGIALAVQSVTNAAAARPLVEEVFRQVGAAAVDTALAFMDQLVNRQIDLLASQDDGTAILDEVARILAAAAPLALPENQRKSLDRANLMLGRRAGIVARQTPGRACEPGRARSVTVQPVFFRSAVADPAPTGGSFAGRMDVTRDVWAKVGVTFTVNAAVTRTDALNKTRGSTNAEVGAVAATRTAAGVEVFMVDNEIAHLGGAGTFFTSPGPASKIVMSDRGTSRTLLAHEMGHALGLDHPGDGTAHDGDADTIMRPSGSHSAPNPTRNTALNATRMRWPTGAATCIRPDP